MAFIVGSIVIGGSLMLAGGTLKGIEAGKQGRNARMEATRRRRLENQYKALQNTRQEVIDQSDSIRALKSEVFNPYANLGVAMQATNMRLEQGDEDLANILQSINQSGAGGGAATQLARMASISKAQAAAGLEQQEAQNQKLRLQGEAQVMQTKLNIEQMAIQEEAAAWSRQENRDIQDMGRVERLEGMANQRAVMAEQQRSQLVGDIGGDMMGFGGQVMGMGLKAGMQGPSSLSTGSGYDASAFGSGFTDPSTIGSGSTLLNPAPNTTTPVNTFGLSLTYGGNNN